MTFRLGHRHNGVQMGNGMFLGMLTSISSIVILAGIQIGSLGMAWRLLVLLSLAACLSCGKNERWNVVLVTFDTTRADYIGCYGNENIQTPIVDRLAAEGVLFEHAYTPVPITLPSHSTMMTGKNPFSHGIRDNGLFVLGENQLTLAEILKARGYRTAAAVASFPLTSKFGINQGFDLFDDILATPYQDLYGRRIFPKERLFFDERKAARVNEALLPWLEENHHEPFFLWAHYFDPHHPHEPPPPYNQLYAHDPYAGEIAYADESFGVLIDNLKRLGVYDKTLIIFTSDHGEGNGEHNESTHSLLLYNATLHVPLVIKAPGGAEGRRVSQRVGTVDLFPTVLEFLGMTSADDIQGQSLLGLLKKDGSVKVPESPLYAETLSPRLSQNWGELRALFEGDYKYIHGPRPELFDITRDPRELNDLSQVEPEIAASLRANLQDYLANNAVHGLDSSTVLDEETAERLMALGYIQSSGAKVGPIEEVLRQDGTPPQDRVGDNSAYSMAKTFLFQGKFVEAQELLQDLLTSDPGNPHYLEMAANAELMVGNHDQALDLLEQLKTISQEYVPPERLLNAMGGIFSQQKKWPQALERYQESQALKATAEGQYMLSQIHGALNQQHEWLRCLENSLSIDAHYVPARLDLAIQLAGSGDLAGAETEFKRAMADQPYHARSFFNYGAFLVQQQSFKQAIPYFERAIALKSDYLGAYQSLVDLHSGLGERVRAEYYYSILKGLAPHSKETRIAQSLLEVDQ